jgi:hypothetical protein
LGGGTHQAHKPGERQFFRMLQSPPAAFNPLHNFAAFSADAKDQQEPDSRCPRHRDRRGE